MTQDRVPLFVRLPSSQAAALDRLADTTGRHKQHLVSELLADRLQVGHIEIDESPGIPAEVLTLDEVAALLRLPTEPVEALAREGALPGRQVAEEWRFARSAVLSWLSRDEHPTGPGFEAAADAIDD
jgi:excisionase family DNA binding protein